MPILKPFQTRKRQRLKGSYFFWKNSVQETPSTTNLPWPWMACQSHSWSNKGRDQWNGICHVTRTPGSTEEALMVFTDLLQERIKDHQVNHPYDHGKPVKVKISEYGARMTTNSSFILLSFALLRFFLKIFLFLFSIQYTYLCTYTILTSYTMLTLH